MATTAALPLTRCILLELPRELRDQVYGHVFADIMVEIGRVKVDATSEKRATNVLLVCHQIYRETVSIYREGYTFRSDATSYANRVLSQLPAEDFLRIRHIQVVYDLQPGPEQGRYPTIARVVQIKTAITMLHQRAVSHSAPGLTSKAPFIRVVLDSGMLVWESDLKIGTSLSECYNQIHAQVRASDAKWCIFSLAASVEYRSKQCILALNKQEAQRSCASWRIDKTKGKIQRVSCVQEHGYMRILKNDKVLVYHPHDQRLRERVFWLDWISSAFAMVSYCVASGCFWTYKRGRHSANKLRKSVVFRSHGKGKYDATLHHASHAFTRDHGNESAILQLCQAHGGECGSGSDRQQSLWSVYSGSWAPRMHGLCARLHVIGRPQIQKRHFVHFTLVSLLLTDEVVSTIHVFPLVHSKHPFASLTRLSSASPTTPQFRRHRPSRHDRRPRQHDADRTIYEVPSTRASERVTGYHLRIHFHRYHCTARPAQCRSACYTTHYECVPDLPPSVR